jgi:hypothetical protein
VILLGATFDGRNGRRSEGRVSRRCKRQDFFGLLEIMTPLSAWIYVLHNIGQNIYRYPGIEVLVDYVLRTQ